MWECKMREREMWERKMWEREMREREIWEREMWESEIVSAFKWCLGMLVFSSVSSTF
jgi:hypothetical protein